MRVPRFPRAAGPLTALLLALGCGDQAASPTESVGGGGRDSGDSDGGVPTRPPYMRPTDGPELPSADEVIPLPLGGPDVSHRIMLEAELGAMDLHLSIDTTASIDEEIDELQRSLATEVIPDLAQRVGDLSMGVSRFEDFPRAPYGYEGSEERRADRPFELLTPITSELAAVTSAVARLDSPLGVGSDREESAMEALWQVATGQGYQHMEVQIPAFDQKPRQGGGELGGVGFRDNALHVVLHVTDAPSHTPEEYGDAFPLTHSLEQVGEALNLIDAKFIGIVSKTCSGNSCTAKSDYHRTRDQLEELALLTGTDTPADGDCQTGIAGGSIPAREGVCPLVFDVSDGGTGLSKTLVDAIVELLDGLSYEKVEVQLDDDPLGFVQRVEAVALPQPNGEPLPNLEDLQPERPDGIDDTFVDVRARSLLAFDVILRNKQLAPSDADQRFRVSLRVMGDGLLLGRIVLAIEVPAGDPTPVAVDDAGIDPM